MRETVRSISGAGARESEEESSLVREDREEQTSSVPVVGPTRKRWVAMSGRDKC